MFAIIDKLFHSSSLGESKRSALQDFASEGHFFNFSIEFSDIESANMMMFAILEMQHEKTVHTMLRIQQTTLFVTIEHKKLEDPNVDALIDSINRKALKIKHG